MTPNRIFTLAILVGFSALIACSDDGGIDTTTDAGSTATTDIPTPDHECGYDAECADTFSDLTPCEDAVCDAGTCVKQTRSTWASCDHPDAGTCEGGYCNDSGQCVVRTSDDGTPCNEENWTACTIGECASGLCVDVSTVLCDDDNPCTDDTCDAETGDCANTANAAVCDDGNPCTSGDVCAEGACAGAEINGVTEDGDICTCSTDAECAIYDDGDLCNGLWGCVEGSCAPVADSEVTCSEGSDNGGCRTNACNPGTGACELTPVENYLACDDGDPCTGCAPGADCENDGDYCQNGTCKPGNGEPCAACTTEEDCASLDDGDMCNGIWSCQKFVGEETGECKPVPNSEVDCAASAGDCVTSACETATGACVDTPVACEAPPADSCDGLMATTYAQVGVCAETEDDSDPCSYEEATTDCDIAQDDACVTSLTGDACDDDTPCADDDAVCTDGLCTTTVAAQTWTYAPSCDDGVCGQDETISLCSDAKANGCMGLMIVAYEATGACNAEGTACEYTTSDVEDCDVPKASECVGANGLAEVRTYAPTCDADGCGHEMTATLCEQAATCDGDILTEYDASCNEDADDCGEFTAVTTDCSENGQLCVDGACSDPCEPATECGEAMNCGTMDDGCGGTIECGTCADGETCSEGMCTAECTPAADCGAMNCGTMDDGCGGTLECGTCADGETCTAGMCMADETPMAANGCPTDCQGCYDGATCTTTDEWWTCGESTVCGWAQVELHVDMNNYDMNAAPNFQGEFNDWCGDCFNTGTDDDMDGVYSFTQYLSPKTWQWKPSIGSWTVISSAPEGCRFNAEDSNYFFEVTEDDVNSGEVVAVGPVCFADGFGTCGACEAPVACDPACGEGETCTDGACVSDEPTFAANGCPSDCMGCFDGEACTATSAWWECGESTVCGWAHVELHVDMNSYDASAAPNFQGEFNEWCGSCSNTGTDTDMDGIYSFTQYLSPKTWQWKPTIGAWSVISSAPDECSFDTENNNYFFEVGADDVNSGVTVDVGPVCFADGVGTCGACETCTPATECTEGMVCGTMDDGCGGTVNCGTCGDGESCNTGVCEADCTPATECTEGMVCGTMDDGCGGTVNCGTCGDGESCNAGVCEADCTPAIACSDGVTCGTETDGCGGTIDCGTCGDGESCNAGVCEADAPAFACEADYADCTEEDFVAGDMTAMEGTIDVAIMGAGSPYSTKCLRVAVGQTVTIEASGGHPFELLCAEDTIFDAQDGATSNVTVTMATEGYYNYRCQFHPMMVGNIHVVAP